MLTQYLIIIIIICSILFTLNFFIGIFFRDKIFSFPSAIFSCSILLAVLIQLIHSLDKLSNYSLLPTYLTFHIIICLLLSMFSFTLLMIPKMLLNEYRSMFNYLKSISGIFNKMKISKFISDLINKINYFFNPFHNIKNSEFNENNAIKLIFIMSYLISGLIVLSPITNSLEQQGMKTSLESFKRDYDLYKNVFVSILIPFILNYLLTLKTKNSNDNINT